MSTSPPGLTFMGSPTGTITPDSLRNEGIVTRLSNDLQSDTSFDMDSVSLNNSDGMGHNHDHQVSIYLQPRISQKQAGQQLFNNYGHLSTLADPLTTPRHFAATRSTVPITSANNSMDESPLPTLAPLPTFGSSGFPRVSTSGQGPLGSYGHIGTRTRTMGDRDALFVSGNVAQTSFSNQGIKNEPCQPVHSQPISTNPQARRSVNMHAHLHHHQPGQSPMKQPHSQSQLQSHLQAQSQFGFAGQGLSSHQDTSKSPPSVASTTDVWQMAQYSSVPPFAPPTSTNAPSQAYATSAPYSGAQAGSLVPHQFHQLQQQLQYQQRQLQLQQPIAAFPSQPQLSVALTQSDIDSNYGYCLDRGNGKFTRLVPADMLPAMKDIPALQDGCSGLVVLPTPRSPPPTGVPAMNQPVTMAHVESATKSSSTSLKKPKIFCDKWVHEGVCAFTQQGCKFKHEMPIDKETQHSLGLFHGLPLWWKRQQSSLQQFRQTASAGHAAEASPNSSESPSTSTAPARSTQPSESRQTQAQTQSQGQSQPQTSPAYTRTLWRSEASGNTSTSISTSPSSSTAYRTTLPLRNAPMSAEQSHNSVPDTVPNSRNANAFSSEDCQGLCAPPGFLSTVGQGSSQGVTHAATTGQAKTRGRSHTSSSFYQPQGASASTGGSCVWGPIAPPAKPQNES
ncbi:hypothetical protein BROUX41_006479 [Berkeleyomyces rouxiae]|uniref:uncharacterized protein n=1 Tax=Berkeleyomyces rouxiae TaxID=2035830 RepID=UPI003B80E71A